MPFEITEHQLPRIRIRTIMRRSSARSGEDARLKARYSSRVSEFAPHSATRCNHECLRNVSAVISLACRKSSKNI